MLNEGACLQRLGNRNHIIAEMNQHLIFNISLKIAAIWERDGIGWLPVGIWYEFWYSKRFQIPISRNAETLSHLILNRAFQTISDCLALTNTFKPILTSRRVHTWLVYVPRLIIFGSPDPGIDALRSLMTWSYAETNLKFHVHEPTILNPSYLILVEI